MRTGPVALTSCTFAISLISGCSQFSAPVAQLDSPEVIAPERQGRIELLGWYSGPSLSDPIVENEKTDSAGTVTRTPHTQSSALNLFMGGSVSVLENTELGFRMHFGGPIELRAKSQWMGLRDAQAQAGNFSLSTVISGGFLFGRLGTFSSHLYFGGISVPLGYRIFDKHMLSLSPLLQMGSVAPTPQLVTAGSALAAGTSYSIYGGSFGYQWDAAQVLFRAEFAYLGGSVSSFSLGSFYSGVLLAIHL